MQKIDDESIDKGISAKAIGILCLLPEPGKCCAEERRQKYFQFFVMSDLTFYPLMRY